MKPDYSKLLGGEDAALRAASEPSLAGKAVDKWEAVKEYLRKKMQTETPITPNMIINGWPKPDPMATDDMPAEDAAPAPDAPPMPAKAAAASDDAPVSKDSPFAADLKLSGADNAAREKMKGSEKGRHLFNLIPEAIAGVGDAMAAGVNAGYHANLDTNASDNIHKEGAAFDEKQKKDFEEGLKNDPNSDISKQYQTSAAKALKMMGTNVDPANLSKMSASQLEAQMPNIEKIAKMQNDKDMKTLQLEALKNQKQSMLDQRKDGMFVRMSTSLGGDQELNDIKKRVNNIERAYPAIDMAKTPQDLVEAGIATLRVINPGGMIGAESLNQYIPKTVGLDAANIIQWISNKPQDSHVQAFLQRYKQLLGREKDVAQSEYERAFNRKTAGLKPILDQNPDVAQQLYQDWGVPHPQYNPQAKNRNNVIQVPGGKSGASSKPASSGDPLGLR